MRPTRGALDEFSETIANGAIPSATAIAALAICGMAVAWAVHWLGRRRGSTGTGETLFVGRWGVLGPELYMVGKRVRRLPGPQGQAAVAPAFAGEMLAEVMRCPPAPQLALTFARAQLEPLSPDGFVVSASEVEAWLDASGRDAALPPPQRDAQR